MSRAVYIVLMLVLISVLFRGVLDAGAQEDRIAQTADMATVLKDQMQLSASSQNMIFAATGLPQAKDFSFAKIVAYVVFGSIGFIAFMYGKKNEFWRPMIVGIALMGYPYFVSSTVVIYLLGIAFTVALYFWRD